MNHKNNWTMILNCLLLVKSLKVENVSRLSYVTRDLGLDSIGVVDFWFELKNEFSFDSSLNDFYKILRMKPRGELYNDFNLQELCDYLKINLNE